MERDGVSRIYITSSGGRGLAWLIHPEDEAVAHDQALTGDAGEEVLSRADYRGVYHSIHPTDARGNWLSPTKEGYGFFEQDGTHFDVDLKGITHSEEGNKKLVETLEKRAKKKGLTIVIS